MKRIIAHRIKNVALFTSLVCATGIVWAANPHYLRADASLDRDLCYSVSLKEAGLGTAASVTYTLSATNACFKLACFTKKGNQINGQPKSGESSASDSTVLPARHGQTTGTVALCPAAFDLPDPGCTGNQELRLLAVSYSGVSLSDNLGTPSPDLPNLSSGTCP